jgi:hypothetical protein
MSKITFESLCPVLPVDSIESCLPFWVDALGFAEVARVPDGGDRVFSLLQSGAVTVMYQTRSSIEKDEPHLRETPLGRAALYLRVDDLAKVKEGLKDPDVLGSERETFYGMRELSVREPGGHVVTFAQSVSG